MREGKFKKSEILDPVGIFYWPFYKGRDGCRTPMKWNASENAGFSSAAPWLPVNPDYMKRNVEEQMREEGSLFNFYKKLLKLRKDHPALRRGDLEMATVVPGNSLIYFRCLPEEQAMIALNFSPEPKKIDLVKNGAANCEVALSSKLKPNRNYDEQYVLDGNEAAIFILKSSAVA
jgi:alpha-glucosidase